MTEILLIDDEEEILEFLERILRQTYTVIKATSAEEGLTLLESHCIQLVISDVMMPGMDGYELCKTLKAGFEHSHIPVILLTAKNTIQSKVMGLELGADAYIEKPFSNEHLKAQIASLLTNRNTIRQYFSSMPLVHMKSMAHSKADEKFLEALNELIVQNIDDADLDVNKLACMLNMTRVTLYRKIKSISQLTPAELINVTRLKKAAELLATGEKKVYEIADDVGFSSQSTFTRSFQKQFNKTPTEYMNELKLQN